jgi:RHS repeat-associated protein
LGAEARSEPVTRINPLEPRTVVGSNADPYQFTGRENDGTGLYFNRARYYSQTFQRFIAADPIGFVCGDANLYAYASNDPTNLTDHGGTSPIAVAIVIGLGIACPGCDVAAAGIEAGLYVGSAALAAYEVSQALAKGSAQDAEGAASVPAVSDVGDPGAEDPGGSCGQQSPRPGKRFTPDQSALIDLAQEAKQLGGVTAEEAQILQDWGDELGVRTRGPELHPERNFDIEHIHIGPIDHIPIR